MAQYKFSVYTAPGIAPTLSALSVSGVDYLSSATKLTTTAYYDGTMDVTEYLVDNAALTGAAISPDVTITTSDASDFGAAATGEVSGSVALTTASGVSKKVFNTLKYTGSAPVFVSVSSVDYAENRTDTALTVVATDANGYSITGGADAAAFAIGGASGELTFVTQPDFESPADADANNVYEVVVTATADGGAVDQTVAITVTDASEADAQTSIDTTAVAQMLGGELTIDGVAEVISGLADAADAADVANKQELINLITPLQTAVQVAQQAADRLEDYEMGQIEDLLTQLVDTEGFQALLETASVTVNGNERSVASILQAIAEAPQVANWKKTVDSNGDMNGVIATLTDGSAVTFDMTTEVVDADTNKHVFSVADFAGTGLAKSFFMVMKAKALSFGGLFGGRLTNAQMGWMLDEVSNILFDITGNAPSAVGGVTVPDYNADGAAGNVTPSTITPSIN